MRKGYSAECQTEKRSDVLKLADLVAEIVG
jgi:hypothetical protein